MKSIQLQLSSALILSLLACTDAISLHKRQDGLEPRVMSIPIQRRKVDDPLAHDRKRLNRRDGTVSVGIENEVSCHEKTIPNSEFIEIDPV